VALMSDEYNTRLNFLQEPFAESLFEAQPPVMLNGA